MQRVICRLCVKFEGLETMPCLQIACTAASAPTAQVRAQVYPGLVILTMHSSKTHHRQLHREAGRLPDRQGHTLMCAGIHKQPVTCPQSSTFQLASKLAWGLAQATVTAFVQVQHSALCTKTD